MFLVLLRFSSIGVLYVQLRVAMPYDEGRSSNNDSTSVSGSIPSTGRNICFFEMRTISDMQGKGTRYAGNALPHDFRDVTRIGMFPPFSPAADRADRKTEFAWLGRCYPEHSSRHQRRVPLAGMFSVFTEYFRTRATVSRKRSHHCCRHVVNQCLLLHLPPHIPHSGNTRPRTKGGILKIRFTVRNIADVKLRKGDCFERVVWDGLD